MIVFHRNYIKSRLHVLRRLQSTTTFEIKEDLSSTAYKPEIVQKRCEKWQKVGHSVAQAECSTKTPFSMVLPPPNVTGNLHLGHALACTLQDVIVRRKRAQDFDVVWIPGTDHAGIATQSVVEKYLKNYHNRTRHNLGREKFVKEVWKWKEQHGDNICNQLRTLGCSLDWSRQRFTMDVAHCRAVDTAFSRLFHRGLVFRQKALVNWSRALASAVADVEVDALTLEGPTDIKVPGYDSPVRFGQLYEFAYTVDGADEDLVVATTMPETMLGDTAVAVHPDDPRYSHLRGKRVHHPFRDETIPIIFDRFVDRAFGTGGVKITPAHSKVDYDIAKKHNLPLIQVIDEDGIMINSGHFSNLKKYDCRQRITQKICDIGLMKRVTPHGMTLPICSRTGDVIDHLPKEQWFLSCSELNRRAEEFVKKQQLKIIPEKYINNWLNWTGDDRDWCISRQLWWGHQIPAYKCSIDSDSVWVTAKDIEDATSQATKLLRAPSSEITVVRDTDVLDTWFSSGIYPFAAMGWPNETNDLKTYYPLGLMATGHDILGFWVHRMVILGLELTGTLPFDTVLLHGVVCDNKGAKMSKSKGNVIDPVDVINGISMKELGEKSLGMFKTGILTKDELGKAVDYHKSNFSNTNGIPECGVDALRFTLLSQDIKSNYINFDPAICHSNKLLCNKIWQSVKYIKYSFAKLKPTAETITKDDLTFFDKWILSRLENMVDKVSTSMDNYDFHVATKALRTHIYNEFCDIYLEATKPGFDGDNIKKAYAHAHTLSAVSHTALRGLAPFMIYLTDEVIPKIPSFESNIIYNFKDKNDCYAFPNPKDFENLKDEAIESKASKILACIDLVRELRGLYSISNKMRPNILISSEDAEFLKDVEDSKHVIQHLTRCSNIQFGAPEDKFARCVLDNSTEVGLEIMGDDIENTILAARAKLQKRIKRAEDSLTRMEAKLSSTKYLESTTDSNQLREIENMLTKRRELEQLQKLIS